EFLALVGSAAVWPTVARAQQPKAMRRIGVLTGGFGPDSQARLEAFLKALAQLGWTDGQNVRLEIRRGAGDAEAIRRHATELAALAPDVQSLATSLDLDLSPIDVQNAAQIERDITAFARSSEGGLIVASSTSALVNRALIVALAARLKLPAIYAQSEFV